MKAFLIHFYIETRTSFRKKQQVFLAYLFPMGFYLLMAAVMPQLNPMFLEDMIPSMIVFAAMTATFLALPEQIVSSRDGGVLRGYRINGLNKASLIFIPALSAIVQTSLVALFILISAPILFDAPAPSNLIIVLPISWLTVFSLSGISVLIGIVSRSSRAAMMLSQAFFIPSMLIGGLMIPLNIMPENLRTAALLLPSSHSMSLFRTAAYGREIITEPLTALAVLVLTGSLGFILSGRLFKWNPA